MYRKITVLAVTACLWLSGCGNGARTEISADYKAADIAYTVVSNLNFSSELNCVDSDIAKIYFNTADSTETSVYLSSTGSEMVAAFWEKANDENLEEIIDDFLMIREMLLLDIRPLMLNELTMR